jgi:ferrochelatase
MNKKAVLLINLGTPDDADGKSVYRYLTQFLNDPRVIDLPFLARWVLVNLIIVPLRYKKSTEAYRQIWLPEGSPLLLNTQKLQQALAKKLGDDYQVVFGMRYGQPSIEKALADLDHCSELTVIPLFPQYASASSGSALEVVMNQLAKHCVERLKIINGFYDNPGFIDAYATLVKQQVTDKNVEHFVFSYHGLPERHIHKICHASCNLLDPCPAITSSNTYCYRAQCYATSALLAQQLNLDKSQYSVTFQSRLGRTPWIKPYTDLVLPELRAKKIKNIAVVCPSFVADCLETLEEIDLRARQQWLDLGGNEFIFVPSINDQPIWVEALAAMVLPEQ